MGRRGWFTRIVPEEMGEKKGDKSEEEEEKEKEEK